MTDSAGFLFTDQLEVCELCEHWLLTVGLQQYCRIKKNSSSYNLPFLYSVLCV